MKLDFAIVLLQGSGPGIDAVYVPLHSSQLPLKLVDFSIELAPFGIGIPLEVGEFGNRHPIGFQRMMSCKGRKDGVSK